MTTKFTERVLCKQRYYSLKHLDTVLTESDDVVLVKAGEDSVEVYLSYSKAVEVLEAEIMHILVNKHRVDWESLPAHIKFIKEHNTNQTRVIVYQALTNKTIGIETADGIKSLPVEGLTYSEANDNEVYRKVNSDVLNDVFKSFLDTQRHIEIIGHPHSGKTVLGYAIAKHYAGENGKVRIHNDEDYNVSEYGFPKVDAIVIDEHLTNILPDVCVINHIITCKTLPPVPDMPALQSWERQAMNDDNANRIYIYDNFAEGNFHVKFKPSKNQSVIIRINKENLFGKSI